MGLVTRHEGRSVTKDNDGTNVLLDVEMSLREGQRLKEPVVVYQT